MSVPDFGAGFSVESVLYEGVKDAAKIYKYLKQPAIPEEVLGDLELLPWEVALL